MPTVSFVLGPGVVAERAVLAAVSFYDRAGRPISVAQADGLLRSPTYKCVARTQVGEQEVSTVWLAVDYGLGHTGPPLIFETLVIPDCELSEHYATEAAALAGHDRMVARVRRQHGMPGRS